MPLQVKKLTIGNSRAARPLLAGKTKTRRHFHRPMSKGILEKKSNGRLYFNDVEVRAVVHGSQNQSSPPTGAELRELMSQEVWVNACIIDAILRNPILFPEAWKRRRPDGKILFVFTVGTVYSNGRMGFPETRRQFVKGVYWENGTVHEASHGLMYQWYADATIMCLSVPAK